MFQKFTPANNAICTLLLPVGNDSSIFLADGNFDRFPASNFIMKVTQYSGTTVTGRENVLVSTRVGNVFNIGTRAYEAVPISDSASEPVAQALPFEAGATLEVVQSAGFMEDIQDEVERLETDKLDTDGLRAGRTASAVFATDDEGNETEITGTPGQVVGFDSEGNPAPLVPTVDIDSLDHKPTPDFEADTLVVFSDADGENQKFFLDDIRASDAETSAGTEDSKFVTPASAKHAYGTTYLSSGTTSGAGTITLTHGLGRVPRLVRVSAHGTASDGTGLTRSTGAYNGTAYACSYGYDSGLGSE